MNKVLLHRWPLYFSLLIFLLLMWVAVFVSMMLDHGHLVYAADDPYIGMAVARNLAHYHVWGLTRYGFTSSSSTLLWTLLLSLTYYLGGVSQLAPLVWNLIFAVLVVVAADAILGWYKVAATARFMALLGMIVLVPIPTLVLSGMEHTLQTLLSLITVFVGARLISGEAPLRARRDAVGLLVLAPLVTSTRFEGMFLIVAVSGFLLLVKRWRLAVGVAVGGFLPVFIHGVISVSHGWFWFPASVLLKASLPSSGSGFALLASFVNPIYISIRQGPHALTLLIAVLLVYILADAAGSRALESRQVMGAIVVFLWVTHLEFVGSSPLFRYDAYLSALSILVFAAQLPVLASRLPTLFSWATWASPRNLAGGVLVLALFLPLGVKGERLLWYLPQCTSNIFEQQYQMGLFVRRYYNGSGVALNDIGAVNYLADIHCLDLMGLANSEVAAAKRKGHFRVEDMREIAKRSGTRIAILYDGWFPGGLPSEWIRVGRWTIRNNVIDGGDTVSFYAVDPGEAPRLSECLTDFSSRLPADVIQRDGR